MIVLSVPHTGSHSLLSEYGEPTVPQTNLFHFGYDDARIHDLGKVRVHIPIRDPIATLMSWDGRNLSLTRCIVRCMAKLVEYENDKAEFHRMESISRREGVNLKMRVGNRDKAVKAWWAHSTPEIRDFYWKNGYEI